MNEITKYEKAFQQFPTAKSDSEITKIVNEIVEKRFEENYTAEVLQKIHGLIDLTSLTALDTNESIWKLVNRVNDFEGTSPEIPNVAAICTYPIFVETVKQSLMAKDVKIASVTAGFPASQTFTEIKVAETAMAVMEGADEVDIVLNLGYLQSKNYDALSEEIHEIKDSSRGAKLKVILETGALKTADKIQEAAILSIYSGADFIKTSTGKEYPGATLEAVYVMCQVIKGYYSISDRKVGIKVSGGVRTAEDAVKYYCIVKEVLGEDWLNADLFRIGASSLLDDIEQKLND